MRYITVETKLLLNEKLCYFIRYRLDRLGAQKEPEIRHAQRCLSHPSDDVRQIIIWTATRHQHASIELYPMVQANIFNECPLLWSALWRCALHTQPATRFAQV
jgi:hypothetical protein